MGFQIAQDHILLYLALVALVWIVPRWACRGNRLVEEVRARRQRIFSPPR